MFYVSVGLFFIRTSVLPTSIYREHNTAQRNQARAKQNIKYVRIKARQRKQADRLGESQHVDEHFYTTRCLPKTNK